MIAKFRGQCFDCGIGIEAGEECDYQKGKGIRHFNCPEYVENSTGFIQKHGLEQEALADRLGYRHYEWEELQKEP